MAPKIYFLSGTPGTGKTSAAKLLTEKGFFVISIGDIVIQKNLFLSEDKERDTKIIDIEKINVYFSKFLTNISKPTILESH